MDIIGQIIKGMVADNKVNFEHPFYEKDDYVTGYADGYNDGLVDLLNKLKIEHNEELRNNWEQNNGMFTNFERRIVYEVLCSR